MSVEVLSQATVGAALAYLARRPYDHVYAHWLIAERCAAYDDFVLWRDAAGAIAGVCFFGPQVIPCTDSPAALGAFAALARQARALRMIVGSRDAVEPFWAMASTFLPKPSAVRTSQPLFKLERSALRFSRFDASVRRAAPDEVDELVPHSARMIAGELGSDPRQPSSDFRARTARIVAARWWWRYRVNGKLAFMCNVGSATPYTAQLQGVWSPPEMRRHGYATRALGAICDHLLDEHPTLCLFVNDFNRSAMALYERVGFSRTGEFQSVLFS